MNVILTQSIMVLDVLIPTGTVVFLDAKEGVGYFNELYFDIFNNEYSLLH